MESSEQNASVSVVIPCYRCADTIERAVKSVVEQTLKPYEVILVEDCSGDNTLEVLYQLQTQYGKDWIKVIPLKENSGPGTARNMGWDASEQEYIAFLDADDSWHPQKIEIQYGWMVLNSESIMSGHAFNYSKNTIDFYKKNSVAFSIINEKSLLFKNKFSTPSVMLKNVISNRFPDEKKYCEDYYLWTEIAFDVGKNKCFYSIEPLVFLHKPAYGSSGLSSHLWQMEKGELEVYKNLYDKNLINFFYFIFFFSLSLMKYIKRALF